MVICPPKVLGQILSLSVQHSSPIHYQLFLGHSHSEAQKERQARVKLIISYQVFRYIPTCTLLGDFAHVEAGFGIHLYVCLNYPSSISCPLNKVWNFRRSFTSCLKCNTPVPSLQLPGQIRHFNNNMYCFISAHTPINYYLPDDIPGVFTCVHTSIYMLFFFLITFILVYL